jgi:hypothetical protein
MMPPFIDEAIGGAAREWVRTRSDIGV